MSSDPVMLFFELYCLPVILLGGIGGLIALGLAFVFSGRKDRQKLANLEVASTREIALSNKKTDILWKLQQKQITQEDADRQLAAIADDLRRAKDDYWRQVNNF